MFKGCRATEKERQVRYDLSNTEAMDVDDGEEEEDIYQPIACSNPKYSFHESECQIIDKLRAWSKEYFERNLIYDHDVHIPV